MKIFLLLILVSFVILTGCESKQSTVEKSANNKQQVLKISLKADVSTFDPADANDSTSNRVQTDLYEGLVTLNQDNQVIPGVAKSWDISKDGKVYTFHLRDDAKWSNGQPVTAGDFVYSLQREMDPKTVAGNNTAFLIIQNAKAVANGQKSVDTLGVKALDKHTLQITLQYPVGYLLNVLATTGGYPVYPPVVKKNPKGWAKPETIVSNGAYQLKTWISNGHITLIKNPYYWDKNSVAINKVKFIPISDATNALNQYNAGQINFMTTLPTGISSKQYRQKYTSQFVNEKQFGLAYMIVNFHDKKLQNLSVRKALSMVIDRSAIVNSVLRMGQSANYGLIAQDVSKGAYDSIASSLSGYSYINQPMAIRIKLAKKMLEKAGYSAEKPLILTVQYSTNDTSKKVVQAIIAMWHKAFGNSVQVTQENQDLKVFLHNLTNKTFDLTLSTWFADYDDPSAFFGMYLCNNANNDGDFCNKTVDRYYNLSLQSSNQNQAKNYMKLALKTAMLQYPRIVLYTLSYSHLIKPYIRGYHPAKNYLDKVYSKWFYFKDGKNIKQDK